MIVTTPIQAVKPPTTTVTRLPFPFDENELELWNVELWRLKKLWKLYKSDYIQSFLRCPLNTYKKKKHSFISTSLQLRYWKNKNQDFLCQVCLLSIDLFWLTSCTFDFFYLRVTSQSWTYSSETLEKLSKHQNLWWKRCAG